MRLVIGGGWKTVLAGVGLLSLLAACDQGGEQSAPPPPRPVDVRPIVSGEVRDTGEYLGELISRQSIELLPQVAGYVRRIHVRPGQKVKQGEPLVEIDARQQTAALNSAQAQKSSAEVQLDLARTTLQRTRALYQEGLASAQELERATAEVKAAEAAARSASAVVSQQSVQLGFNVVNAPFDGTVGEVFVRVGNLVSASSVLTTLSQSDVLEIGVAIPSDRARTLRPNSPIEILDKNGNVVVTSTLFYVDPVADPLTQLVEVKAAFRNDVGLRPNERVRARVVYATREALLIPMLAVVRQSGQPFAMVVEEKDGGHVVNRHPITLGPLGSDNYVVESGLQEGTLIAVSSLQLLRDGARIEPRIQTPHNPETTQGTAAGMGGAPGAIGAP